MEAITLVSGGAGFLWSHLCDRLLKQKKEVICVDNFQTGKHENISHLIGKSGFSVLEHNVWDPIDINVDYIFNLACPASPIAYQKDPVSTVKTAVLGALNMLDLANQEKASIFQASTSEVYGDPKIHPQEESYWGHVNPVGVRSCYDEGKRCAETLFFDYHRQFDVDIKVGRIFNTYGPRMQIDDGRAVSNFIVQALNGDEITVYGNGNQTRSFCYVDDLIEGILGFVACGLVAAPVNLGNPHEVSIVELAELICRYPKSNSKIVLKPLPMDDPNKRKPDIGKIKRLTGWSPKVTLEDGLKETIKYFQRTI